MTALMTQLITQFNAEFSAKKGLGHELAKYRPPVSFRHGDNSSWVDYGYDWWPSYSYWIVRGEPI